MYAWIGQKISNHLFPGTSKKFDSTVSFRVRLYRNSDSEEVRQILRESKLIGVDSPLHQMIRAEFTKPRAVVAYWICIASFILGTRSTTLWKKCLSMVFGSSACLSIAFWVLKVRSDFIKFVDDGLADDVSAIPQHYQMSGSEKDIEVLLPSGKNAFWVAEAYGEEAIKAPEIGGCIGLDATTAPTTNFVGWP